MRTLALLSLVFLFTLPVGFGQTCNFTVLASGNPGCGPSSYFGFSSPGGGWICTANFSCVDPNQPACGIGPMYSLAITDIWSCSSYYPTGTVEVDTYAGSAKAISPGRIEAHNVYPFLLVIGSGTNDCGNNFSGDLWVTDFGPC